MLEGKYWYCLTHHRVEKENGCPNQDRLGPYDTVEAASHALKKVEERNEAWDNDPAWKEDEPEDADPEEPED